MKLRMKQFSLVALGACMALPLSVPAADTAATATNSPDTTNWVCKLCVVSGGWFGDWDMGLIYVSDPDPKFADWRGLDDDWFIELSGNARYIGEAGNYFDFYGRNLGLDSRDLELRGGKAGRYQLRADYQEIPRYLGYGTTTPFAGVGTDTLVLPEAWQGVLTDTGTFAPAELDSKRKTYGAGLTFKWARHWSYELDVERQTREGTRAFSSGVFPFNGVIFPAPLDYTTDLFDMALKFTGDRGQLRLGFMGSEFDNGNHSVTFDNPFALGFGDDIATNALEPDNEFAQLNLVGAYRFSQRIRISGKAAVGTMEQDLAFLPYSTNPDYADRALPRESLDGEVETTVFNLAGRLVIMLADRLDLTAAYKTDERDNKTPVDEYAPIMLDMYESSLRTNRPYSYDRSKGLLELRWRPMNRMRLNAGLRRDTIKRTYQEIRKSEEDSIWADLQFISWAWLDTRIKLESLSRDTSEHVQQGNYERAEHPLMRKYNMADRDRRRGTLEFNIMPLERLAINLSWYATEDDYDDSEIGLTAGEESSINLDLSYLLNDDTSLYGFVTAETIESDLSGAPGAEAMPWYGSTEDDILTWGLGISGRFGGKFAYGFDYVSSSADGDILVDSGAGEGPFPTLTTELSNARIYLDYDLSQRWTLGLDAYREEYDASDWYTDGLGPLDVSGLLTMGDESPDYDVTVVRLLAKLRF